MDQSEGHRRYSDPEAFRDYLDRDEWEVCVERGCRGRREGLDAWFSSIWEGQDGPVMVNPGEGRGRVGSVRRIPRVWMTERIVSVGLPGPSSEAEVVPSISDTLEHFSASSYLGHVRFVPTDREPPSMARVAVPDSMGFGLVGSLRLFIAMTRFPALQALLDMSVPTLAVLGARDPLLPPAARVRQVQRQMADHMAVAVIKDAAHAINFSHPRELSGLIRDFVNGAPMLASYVEDRDRGELSPIVQMT